MNITKTAHVFLHALSRNKMRSFLTALGIIIGVGALVLAFFSLLRSVSFSDFTRREKLQSSILLKP